MVREGWGRMDLFEAIVNRKTANSKFADKKVTDEHIEMLIKMSSHCPSHFNSQPWRFIAVTDKKLIGSIAKIAGDSMVELMNDGRFWKQYRKYFRFSEEDDCLNWQISESTLGGFRSEHAVEAFKAS